MGAKLTSGEKTKLGKGTQGADKAKTTKMVSFIPIHPKTAKPKTIP